MAEKRTAAEIKAQLAAFQGNETYNPNQALPGSSVPGNTQTNNNTPAGAADNSALMAALTERLTSQGAGISSSSSSQLQSTITNAIADTQTAGNLTRERLQSERGREIAFAQDRASAEFTGAMENRTGYATQVVALRELTETTGKEIKDLDQRYQESIMANDAATASRVADLRMQKLEFLQEQEQNFYSNMFQLANLQSQEADRSQQESQFQRGLTADQARQERQLGFDLDMFEREGAREERNEVMRLAAEYGVPVGANETIESMVGKVAPFASEEQRLRLEEIRASIGASNARAADAMDSIRRRGEAAELDDVTTNAYALAYLQGDEAVMVGLETMEQGGAVLNRVQEIRSTAKETLSSLAEVANSAEEMRTLADASGIPIPASMLEEVIADNEQVFFDRARAARKAERQTNRVNNTPTPVPGMGGSSAGPFLWNTGVNQGDII